MAERSLQNVLGFGASREKLGGAAGVGAGGLTTGEGDAAKVAGPHFCRPEDLTFSCGSLELEAWAGLGVFPNPSPNPPVSACYHRQRTWSGPLWR